MQLYINIACTTTLYDSLSIRLFAQNRFHMFDPPRVPIITSIKIYIHHMNNREIISCVYICTGHCMHICIVRLTTHTHTQCHVKIMLNFIFFLLILFLHGNYSITLQITYSIFLKEIF